MITQDVAQRSAVAAAGAAQCSQLVKNAKRVGKYFTLYLPTVEVGPLNQSEEFLLDEKYGRGGTKSLDTPLLQSAL